MIAATIPPLTFTIDPAGLKRVAGAYGLTAREFEKALSGAVNDVAKRTRNNIRAEVSAYVTLPKKSINPRIEFTKRASQSDPTAVVSLDRRSRGGGTSGNARPTLMSFDGAPKVPRREAKRTKKGKLSKTGKRAFDPFTYQILKAGGRKELPGGFVQMPTQRFNLQSGQIEDIAAGARSQAFRRKGRSRYPLVVPRGPSIAAIWQAELNPIQERVIEDTRGRLAERVNDRVGLTLAGQFKKKG